MSAARRFGAACAGLLAVTAAMADAPAPIVKTMGEATIHAVPSHADFFFHFTAEAENLETAVTEAERFAARLREAIQGAELTPAETEYTAPAVRNVDKPAAHASARLRFSLAQLAPPDDGLRRFARLCDKIADIAERLDATARGPVLVVADRTSMERAAVAAATERAYPLAEVVADALRSVVYAVDTVEIEAITWTDAGDRGLVGPTLRQVSCTARVRVTYALAPQP